MRACACTWLHLKILRQGHHNRCAGAGGGWRRAGGWLGWFDTKPPHSRGACRIFFPNLLQCTTELKRQRAPLLLLLLLSSQQARRADLKAAQQQQQLLLPGSWLYLLSLPLASLAPLLRSCRLSDAAISINSFDSRGLMIQTRGAGSRRNLIVARARVVI